MSAARSTLHRADVRYALIQALRNHALRFDSYQIAKITGLSWYTVKYYMHDPKNKARWRARGL